ncbi:MAG: Uma2 family endonuclease [Pelatocladus maniniholoensis HA4357-MV3]|uniref:Uma2 family endonuclease n=1 Tax=Pelatocladus maniniholoensis HA4357-MV3 TaxID=1117104 RepID=A0A9E3HBK4_9NOST|nr:Uma2 family endonuclease [Pelatocladus maniniholoensis HA4357-MV3]
MKSWNVYLVYLSAFLSAIHYRTLESLEEYVLVSQEEIKVEVYRKDYQGNWLLEILTKEDKLQLKSVGLNLTMSDIYEDVFTI